MKPLTAVSLFAGVGGIDLALERAGVEVVAAVEKDKAARGVLADRFPKATLFPDVTEVTADDLRAAGFVPRRGIVTAGWPCQGNSVAGRRKGLADPRSGLWAHVVRLLGDLRPAWFLGENVPGLLSVTDGEDFGRVLQDLADLGMGFAYRVLDAQHFGVPQRRRRVFLVGCAGDDRRPVQVLLEPEGGGGDSPAGVAAREGAAGAATDGVDRPVPAVTAKWAKGTGGPSGDECQNLIVSTLQAAGGDRGYRIDAEAAAGGHLVPFQKVIRSGERDAEGNLPPEVWATRDVAATLNCGDNGSESRATELIVHPLAVRGRDGGAQIEVGPEGGPYNALRAGNGGSSRQSLIAETVRTHPRPGSNSSGQIVHTATTVRRLTPRECERLQGFPDDWTATSNGKPQADSPRYKQMGNAVAVPCVEWIARRIVATDGAA